MSAQPAHVDQLNPAAKQALSDQLDREGVAEVPTGKVIRPLSLAATKRKTLPEVEPQEEQRPSRFPPELLARLGEHGPGYAQALKAHGDARTAVALARTSPDHAQRAQVPELEAAQQSAQLDLADARARLRVAILDACQQEAERAAAAYALACQDVAYTAARLEAFATLRDDLIGRTEFDPMGWWMNSTLLAPPEVYCSKAFAVAPDVYGRPAYFDARSVTHLEYVRREKLQLREALAAATGASPWPFDH